MKLLKIDLLVILFFAALPQVSAGSEATRIIVTVDRGRDLGQSFGSLFEATSDDGSLVFGAGFQNAYNTRYRGDRHAVQSPPEPSPRVAHGRVPKSVDMASAPLISK